MVEREFTEFSPRVEHVCAVEVTDTPCTLAFQSGRRGVRVWSGVHAGKVDGRQWAARPASGGRAEEGREARGRAQGEGEGSKGGQGRGNRSKTRGVKLEAVGKEAGNFWEECFPIHLGGVKDRG